MGKKRKRYSVVFRQKALALMQQCDSVRALARQLGVSRGTLYYWKRRAAQQEDPGPEAPSGAPDRYLADVETTVLQLEREAALRSLGNGYFKSGKLQHHEGLRTRKSPPKRKRKE